MRPGSHPKWRFSVRALLWLLTAAALPCGLFAFMRLDAARFQTKFEREFQQEQALVRACPGNGFANFETKPCSHGFSWNPLRKEEYRERVVTLRITAELAWSDPDGSVQRYRSDISKTALKLCYLEEVILSGPECTDADVAWAVGLPRLRRLVLFKAAVSDDGITLIAQCPTLEELYIVNFGGKAVAHLDPIFPVTSADVLAKANLTATGDTLVSLAKCRKLKTFEIGGWDFEEDCLSELRRLRTDMTVVKSCPCL